jgi:competence protein ComEA
MPAGQVDINSASEKDLEQLSGVGPATAKKIIAGRPYSSVDDLKRAGVSQKTIDQIRPNVTAAGAAQSASAPASKGMPLSSGPIDINTASAKDLETLPGVGPATSKKIIAGRPYTGVDDLKRAGVSQKTIDQIRASVTAGAAGQTASTPQSTRAQPRTDESSNPSVAKAPAAAPAPAQAAEKSAPAVAPAQAQAPPQPGLVWVNTDSGIFHREGGQWYGRTKHGKWMSEADAVKAGYRPSKTQ